MKLNNIQFDLNSFATEMAKLKNDQHFDFLVTIVGEDFGEEGLGCIYILENTLTHERMSVKAVNANRDEAYIPSVSHLWKAAEILEREVYDSLVSSLLVTLICVASSCVATSWDTQCVKTMIWILKRTNIIFSTIQNLIIRFNIRLIKKANLLLNANHYSTMMTSL